MMTTLILGTDGTESSRIALRWGLERAAAIGSTVRLVHVFDDEWDTVGPRVISDLRADAQRVLDREMIYAQSISAGVDVERELLCGDPMERLTAVSEDVSMIIVGTHKTGYVHGKVIGSRSLRLAAAARCAVGVIPESVRHDARGVVVGADNSSGGRAAVLFAAAEAARLHEPLTVVRGWVPPRVLGESEEVRAERDRLIERSVTETLSEAAALAQREHPGLEVRRRSIQRTPAEALLETAAPSRMLVVGSTRRATRGEMGLGEVTHDVLLNLVTPTIVVHSDDVR